MVSGQVETYSGFRLHERPRRFAWQEEWLEVRRLLDRWQEPGALHFKVEASDGRVYRLSYDQSSENWEVRLWSGKKPQ
ncbi:MAG: hypothetical protein AB1491_04575 [Thermodesulfobacteriota bacterium]